MYNYAYLSIPIGCHSCLHFVYCVCLHTALTFLFRLASSNRVPPYLLISLVITSTFFSKTFYKVSFFKHRDDRDNQVERYGIEPWMKFPPSLRFDAKITMEAKRLHDLKNVTVVFVFLYPILGGVFFQANVILQACLIPVFFALRSWFEYKSDIAITNTFGSDKLPFLSFGGVMLHEICLSVMITSIKHPLVFITLVLADVFENAFCLWSLSRSKASSSTVAPVEHDSSSTCRNANERLSFTKRSSSILSLSRDLRNVNDGSSEGTALFIAAILLQREMCETIVPMQAAFVLTVLYVSDVRSNSMVSHWSSSDDYIYAMTYLSIDLIVELVVFAGTVLVLKKIYPNFSAFRILMGLVRSSSSLMLAFTTGTWLLVLLFQNTLSGMDLTLKFEWLRCDVKSNNSTWMGGFDWNGC